MTTLLKWIKQNPLFVCLILLAAAGTASATPPTYDLRTAAAMPAEFNTMMTNAMAAMTMLTGGGVVLTALKTSVGLVAGLIRSMFSA